jgi:hypothetical protein
MDKMQKSCTENFHDVNVIAARKVFLDPEEDSFSCLNKLLQNSRINNSIRQLTDLSLPLAVEPASEINKAGECWLTVSEEIDGITFLDIYRTE